MDPRFLGWPDGDQRILDPEDARDAVRFGADGIVVLTTVAASWTVYSLPLVRCPHCRCGER